MGRTGKALEGLRGLLILDKGEVSVLAVLPGAGLAAELQLYYSLIFRIFLNFNGFSAILPRE